MAESDIEGYNEKVWVDAGVQAMWVSVGLMGGGIWMDWVTARSSIGEFFHGRRIEIREVFQLESTKAGTLGGNFESPGHFGDSGTPLVCHPSQTCRSFLPCRQKFQEVTEIIDAASINNSICHSGRQVREDDFQGIAGMGNVRWAKERMTR